MSGTVRCYTVGSCGYILYIGITQRPPPLSSMHTASTDSGPPVPQAPSEV